LLKTTNKELKTLLHNLNKVVKTGEDYHKRIDEFTPSNIEVLDGGITVNLKIDLRGKNPPCVIHFNYNNAFLKQGTAGGFVSEAASSKSNPKSSGGGDLFVYLSK
jgi:hypothetical protein